MCKKLISTKDMNKNDWLQWRNKGIGGSDVSVICGINKYKSPMQLWLEKTSQTEQEVAGESAYWGTIMEPIIIKEFMIRTNLKVRKVPFLLQHDEHKFLLANIDGVVNDPTHGNCIFEAKTSSVFRQEEWEEDKIPDEYMLQIQHYMAVTGYKGTYIAVLIGGNTFKYKFIARDEEIISYLLEIEIDFWKHVETNTPPPFDGSAASGKLLNSLYPKSVFESKISLPSSAKDLISMYEEFAEKEQHAAEQKETAINNLKSMLGDYEYGEIDDRLITWKSIESQRFNTKLFKEEHQDLYDKYINKSSYRKFTIK